MKLSSLIGQTLDDKYLIEKQLGKGGMGAVYFAIHIGTGRPVAVKVISPQFMANDEFVERFRREAKAAGRLRHPNVVDVTDFGFAQVGRDRVAYLVMEYLDGCSLGDILAEESRLPLDWVVDILEQACSAVDEAHKQGIVHRDLKPDNIWLEPNRRGGYTVKVLDFGLAKLGERVTGDLLPSLEDSRSASTDWQASPPLVTQTLEQTKKTQVMEGETQAHPPDFTSAASTDAKPDRQTQVMQPQEGAQTQVMSEAEELRTRGVGQPERKSPERREEGPVAQRPAAGTGEGAAVRLQAPPDAENILTLIQLPEEAQTRIQLLEEDQTQILTDPSVSSHPSTSSVSQDSSEGLTRVGSVLGTPLYMSPEQCHSLPLDWRTDIYSLGVIAYQMLTGATPFSGEISEVMRQHIEVSPPPFREVKARVRKRKRKFKIPKRVEAIIRQALEKNREDRPQSAAAFASMLRAGSDGAGALLRRSVALYGEYFPKFFLASLLVNLPGILLEGLMTLNTLLLKTNVIEKMAGVTFIVILALLKAIFSFLASSVLSGVTVRMVTQLMVAPLRPVRLRHAFAAVRQRLRPFLLTTAMVTIINFIGLALCLVPGIILMIHYALTLPVVMMENLSGRAAMRRAKALAKRSKRTVAFIVCVQLGLPLILSSTIGGLVSLFIQAEERRGVRINIDSIAPRIAEILRIPIDILLIPLLAIMTALLYLKMRSAGGEDLNATLPQFEDQNEPKTKWQQRMRERLTISTPSK